MSHSRCPMRSNNIVIELNWFNVLIHYNFVSFDTKKSIACCDETFLSIRWKFSFMYRMYLNGQKGLFFLNFGFWPPPRSAPHSVLMNHSWLSSGEHIQCQGLNLGQLVQSKHLTILFLWVHSNLLTCVHIDSFSAFHNFHMKMISFHSFYLWSTLVCA